MSFYDCPYRPETLNLVAEELWLRMDSLYVHQLLSDPDAAVLMDRLTEWQVAQDMPSDSACHLLSSTDWLRLNASLEARWFHWLVEHQLEGLQEKLGDLGWHITEHSEYYWVCEHIYTSLADRRVYLSPLEVDNLIQFVFNIDRPDPTLQPNVFWPGREYFTDLIPLGHIIANLDMPREQANYFHLGCHNNRRWMLYPVLDLMLPVNAGLVL